MDLPEGGFVELPGDAHASKGGLRIRLDAQTALEFWQWFRLHRRGVLVAAVIVVAVGAIAHFELFVPVLVLALWGWYALIAGSILFALAQWLARAESRSQVRQFLEQFWRELLLAAIVSLVIGEVARADDLGATALLASFAFLFVLAAVGSLVERTAVGQRFHSLGPAWFLVAIALIYVTGPRFVREMPTDNCDDPAYWVVTDYNENDYGGSSPIYSCYDPGIDDYIAPRVEGRSLFGLQLSNIGLRIYSLNFSDGRFEGVGFCAATVDCFP